MILDEVTSAVDQATQAVMMNHLMEWRLEQSCLVIMIAHRLSVVQNADRIIVFKEGAIENIGNHEQLLENSTEYQRLQQAVNCH